jgi:hypothetical protein
MNTSPTILCPVCRQPVELTPAQKQVRKHKLPSTTETCLGSGRRFPDAETERLHKSLLVRSRVQRALRSVRLWVFVVFAGILSILSYFGFTPNREEPTSDTTSLYYSTSGGEPAAKPSCWGALSICLAMPEDAARAQLGTPSETYGGSQIGETYSVWPVADELQATVVRRHVR